MASLRHLLVYNSLLMADVVVSMAYRVSILILLLLRSNESLLVRDGRPFLGHVRSIQLRLELVPVGLLRLLKVNWHEIGAACQIVWNLLKADCVCFVSWLLNLVELVTMRSTLLIHFLILRRPHHSVV